MKNWLSVIVADKPSKKAKGKRQNFLLFPFNLLLSLSVLSGTSWSVENYGIRSPVGPGTIPPSSYSSGLIRSPNPMGTGGNLIITGNVSGGKHFRGVVPYGATTSFGASLGSSSLDSFLRQSAGAGDFSRYTGGYTPFYSPTGTVATTQVGRSGVFTPPVGRAGFMPATTKISGRAPLQQFGMPMDGLALGAAQEQPILSSRDISAAEKRLLGSHEASVRPMSRTPQELERVISNELARAFPQSRSTVQPRSGKPTAGRYQDLLLEESGYPLLKKGEWELSTSAMKEAVESKPGPSQRSGAAAKAGAGLQPSTEIEPIETQAPEEPTSPAPPGGVRASEAPTPRSLLPTFPKTGSSLLSREWEQAYRSRTRDGDEFTSAGPAPIRGGAGRPVLRDGSHLARYGKAGFEPRPSDRGEGELRAGEETRLIKGQPDVYERMKRQIDAAGIRQMGLGAQIAEKQEKQDQQRYQAEGFSSPLEGLSRFPNAKEGVWSPTEAGISTRAKAILGRYKTLASFLEEKFNWYIQAAEVYLKQGKYYRAADAYTLASIYKPADPLAHAGKSLALFAAGEYVSSALFLSRALEILPEYARLKVDLVATLGGKDKIESRIADVKECLKVAHKVEHQMKTTADLQFLLGYIYYQTDRLDEAKAMIEAAFENLPDSPAVNAVKKAIEDAMQ